MVGDVGGWRVGGVAIALLTLRLAHHICQEALGPVFSLFFNTDTISSRRNSRLLVSVIVTLTGRPFVTFHLATHRHSTLPSTYRTSYTSYAVLLTEPFR
jgi:hypothetical protein